MWKRYLLSGIILLNSVFIYAQNFDLDLRWKVIDTPVVFPDDFNGWIKRNIGENYSGYNNQTNKPFGQIIQTDQTKHFIDFNKDGKKDIVLELKFRGYMTDSVLDARQQFYKGIFIAQPNGKYLLDTNFIISGRGYENGGEFGDFDGDGDLDYINIIANYHGKQEWKPLDLYKYGNNLSPSIVNINNGKSFVQSELDVDPEFFSSSGVLVSDIDNDTNDEIILSVSEKFVIYKYNKSNKSFERKVLNLNNKLTQSYGRYITWISEPMIDKTHFIAIISFNNSFSGIGVSDLAVIKIDVNKDDYEVLNILKQPSYTWPDGQFSVASFHTGPFYKYYDLDNDGKDEFIMIGAPGRELNGSRFYAERMGINVFKNNDNVTTNFYNIDTLDNLPKGYFGKLNKSIVIFPWANGLNDVIKVDSVTFDKYNFVYYRFDNGKFIRKKMIFDLKNNPLPYMDTWNVAEDFNNDGLTDLFIAHPDDLRNNKLLIPIYCNQQKPTFNTTNLSFCPGDSLKLSITNVNKSDSIKWYFGSNADLTNVVSKTFRDSVKLFVIRTDSIGCSASSDTIQLILNSKPAIPATIASSVCIGGTANALSATATTGNSLRWYGTSATGGTASTSAPTASSSTAGVTNYYVSQVSAQGCESDRSILKHTVNPLPAKPVISWSGVQFSTTATGVNYQWLLNGTSISGATASTHKPLNTGDFKLRVTDPNGCVNVSDSFKLVVTALANLATTPASNIATVYPNPASDKVVLEFAALPTINLTFQLVTPSGKVLSSTTGRNKVNIVDVSKVKSGNYFIRVIGKKYDQVKKVLIQK